MMIIKTVSVVLLTTILFSACSSRGAMDYFNKNEHFERAMTNLQIGTLVKDLETKAVFKAIYLNQAFTTEYQDGENFYISTYIDRDPYDEKMRGLNNQLYSLKLNDKNATKIIELDQDNTLRLEMPIRERWNRYYHVRFDKVEGNDFNLTFTHKHLGSIVLKYSKDELEK